MIQTKKSFENIHGFNVLGGYISSSHDQYVQGKLGQDFISSKHRIEMVQKAIQEENQQHWLAVDQSKVIGIYLFLLSPLVISFFFFIAPIFVSSNKVTLSLQNFLNGKFQLDKPIRVIFVAGLDLFNRCNGMNGLRQAHMGGVAVVYRNGQNKDLIKSLINQNNAKAYFISLDDQEQNQSTDISSTLIRQKLQINEDCSHFMYKSFLEYLQMTHSKK